MRKDEDVYTKMSLTSCVDSLNICIFNCAGFKRKVTIECKNKMIHPECWKNDKCGPLRCILWLKYVHNSKSSFFPHFLNTPCFVYFLQLFLKSALFLLWPHILLCPPSDCFSVQSVRGMMYNPASGAWSWINSTAINYALHAVKLAEEPPSNLQTDKPDNSAASQSWATEHRHQSRNLSRLLFCTSPQQTIIEMTLSEAEPQLHIASLWTLVAHLE